MGSRVCVCNQFVCVRVHTRTHSTHSHTHTLEHAQKPDSTREDRAADKKDTFGICPATDEESVEGATFYWKSVVCVAVNRTCASTISVCTNLSVGCNKIIDYGSQISCAHFGPPNAAALTHSLAAKNYNYKEIRMRTLATRSLDRNKTRQFSHPNGPPIITHKHALI